MTALSVENISLAYGDNVILQNVSFSINDGDKLGIVGVNGAGKSTLLKIITGIKEQTSGNVYISGNRSVMMLDQNISFDDECTLLDAVLQTSKKLIEDEKTLDNIHAEMLAGNEALAGRYADMLEKFIENGGLEFRNRAKGILISLGFAEERFCTPVNLLSGGEKTRLSLGRILYIMPDIMILDEPTNHLDITSLRWLEEHLSNYRKTIIVVSHDRYFLDKVTNKTLDIENKKGKLYIGNYSEYTRKKKQDREIQKKHFNEQQREIARIQSIIAQQVTFSMERNYRTIESKQKQIERMEKLDKPENLPENVRINFPECSESGNDVLTMLSLSKSYGSKQLFKNFDYLVKRKDRVLIIGDNGCGKSTLLRIITDKLMPDDGDKYFGYNVQPGYYDQENQQLHNDNTVFNEMSDAFPDRTISSLRNTLALFGFKSDDVFKKVGDLSGGEKAKLTICKLVTAKSNLLILDEPTNHIDIPTREILEDAILAYNGTVIAVSHDRYFIEKIATRLIVFCGKEKPTAYEGSYDEYIYHKELENASANEKNGIDEIKKENAANDYQKEKKKASEDRKKKRRYIACKEEISKLEAHLDAIEGDIIRYETDHVMLSGLYAEKEKSEEELLSLYEEFESLSEYSS